MSSEENLKIDSPEKAIAWVCFAPVGALTLIIPIYLIVKAISLMLQM